MFDDDDNLPADSELAATKEIQPDDPNSIPPDTGDNDAENKEGDNE